MDGSLEVSYQTKNAENTEEDYKGERCLQEHPEESEVYMHGDSCYGHPIEEDQPYIKEEQSAVDLRTNKSVENDSEELVTIDRKKEATSIAQLLERFYYNESCNGRNYLMNTTILDAKDQYACSTNESSEENYVAATDYSMHAERNCMSPNTNDDKHLRNSTTMNNSTSILQTHQETIILKNEKKDASVQTMNYKPLTFTVLKNVSVQTDLDPTILACSLFKNVKTQNYKYSCSMCQRLYSTKSSYERHLKTHAKHVNNKVITNVRFTTEAKLQVYKRQLPRNQTNKPIVIQVTHSKTIQCEVCQKVFPTQIERNYHDCTIEPLPMTKCPECPFMFYTIGCLNEHMGIAHKKDTAGNNSYYCILCDETFDTGYSFHLHLDNHLSP